MGHTWKKGTHLEKRIKLGKMRITWEKQVALVKLGQTCKNETHLEIRTHLEKWVTLGKMGSNLEKWVTLEKESHLKK